MINTIHHVIGGEVIGEMSRLSVERQVGIDQVKRAILGRGAGCV